LSRGVCRFWHCHPLFVAVFDFTEVEAGKFEAGLSHE